MAEGLLTASGPAFTISQLLGSALGIGGGAGLLGGLARGKGLGRTLTDIAQGGGAGLLGGGALGAGLAAALGKDPIQAAIIGGSLGSGVIGALRGSKKNDPDISPEELAYANPMAGAMLAPHLIAQSKISSIYEEVKCSSILDEITGKHMEDGIHRQVDELTEDATNEREVTDLTKKAVVIVQQGGYGGMRQPQRASPSGPSPEMYEQLAGRYNSILNQYQNRLDESNRKPSAPEIPQAQLEHLQRKQMARGIASPLGAYAGRELGKAVSGLAGTRKATGLKGLMGFKEKRIGEDKAKQIGELAGQVGASELAGRLI